MNKERSYISTLNRGLGIFFSEFVRVSLSSPIQAFFFLKVVLWQLKAMRRRSLMMKEGLHVPPITIFSITNRCNLRCKGCYAQAIREGATDELSPARMREIIMEADGLGVSFFIIAGGEPLMRPEIMEITKEFPRIIFLLVTNGLLLDSALIKQLSKQRNTVPVLSIEGTQIETDERRGAGVHKRLESKMEELKKEDVFFSVSITMTRSNFDIITDAKFIQNAIKGGCKFFLFLEYTPIRKDTEDWVITDKQRNDMKNILTDMRRRFKSVFIAVPWDEEESGGCLAAGRGFVHINASGDLEPCPFAPYSDVNLKNTCLRDALQSPFIKRMRDNHEKLSETGGGCALWNNREWVRGLLKPIQSGEKTQSER
jgi:MoaA/NifB/PqqE/SkfB family radical SAM enzyme